MLEALAVSTPGKVAAAVGPARVEAEVGELFSLLVSDVSSVAETCSDR